MFLSNIAFVLLLILVQKAASGIHQATADDLVRDDFSTYDKDIWKQSHEHFVCNELPHSQTCFLSSKHNLNYILMPPKDNLPWQSELQIWLKNDCYEKRCCHEVQGCTTFTGGEITSKHSYPYGRFWFLVRAPYPSPPESFGSYASMGCFALHRNIKTMYSEFIMAISVCFSSKSSQRLEITVQYGEQVMRKYVKLSSDPRMNVGLYRIDWLPGDIVISLDHQILCHITDSDVHIPDEPMYMHVFIVPVETVSNSKEAATIMSVYSVTFKKVHVSAEHTDLRNLVIKRKPLTSYAAFTFLISFGMMSIYILRIIKPET